MLDKTSELLNDIAFKIGTLREARNLYSEQLAPEFNIFDFLRTDEMGLSSCIATLLDPKGAHGQRDLFLTGFLDCVGPAVAWAKNAKIGRVATEKQTNDQRRIDIFLDFQNAGIIGIENKPWAGDQDQQLSDYAKYLEASSRGKRWMLVFLSNREPSDSSLSEVERTTLASDEKFIRLDYAKIIIWLEDCASKSKSLVVRTFVEEMAKFIRVKINGEFDMSEARETSAIILRSRESISSAFQVFRALTDVKDQLLNKLKADLEAELRSFGFILVWDKDLTTNGKLYVGFGVKFREQQDKYLRFEFEASGLNGLIWGIKADSQRKRLNLDAWEKINDLMRAEFGDGRSSNWWPWYSMDLRPILDDEIRNWGDDPTAWLRINDAGDDCLAKRVATIARRTHEALATNLELLSDGDQAIAS